jgi:hypothetical protein
MGEPRYRRTASLAFRRILDEVVLVPIRVDAREALGAYHLNPSAAVLWEALETPCGLEALAARLCARFEVDPDRARVDARACLEELVSLGAVERVTEP